MPFYLTPKQDDSNQELQVCITEAGGTHRGRGLLCLYGKKFPHRARWIYKIDLVTMKHVPSGFANPPDKRVEPDAANRAAHARRLGCHQIHRQETHVSNR